jgi:hypothetical protein
MRNFFYYVNANEQGTVDYDDILCHALDSAKKSGLI